MTQTTQTSLSGGAALHVVPMAQDNYGYILVSGETVLVVDVTVADPMIRALRRIGRPPTAVLITHGDHDHIDGLPGLLAEHACPVYAHPDVRLAAPGKSVRDGERVVFGDVSVEVFATPGHTHTDLTFHVPAHGVAFCGDTLFVGGCGRAWTKDPALLFASFQKLNQLPPETLLCGGHEYTADNFRFAREVLADDPALAEAQEAAVTRRDRGQPTMPTFLSAERKHNLYFRTAEPALALALGTDPKDPEAGFVALRNRKDSWAG